MERCARIRTFIMQSADVCSRLYSTPLKPEVHSSSADVRRIEKGYVVVKILDFSARDANYRVFHRFVSLSVNEYAIL